MTRCVRCDSYSVEADKKKSLMEWVLFAWRAHGDLDQVTGYWLPITIVEFFVFAYFVTIICFMIWFVISVSHIWIYFPFFFQASPSGNSDPGAKSNLLRVPMTARASRFIARIVLPFIPSSTHVGMCLPTILGALDRYWLPNKSYSIQWIESMTSTPEIFEINHYRRSGLTTIYPPTHSFAKIKHELPCPRIWKMTRDISFRWTRPITWHKLCIIVK